MIPKWAGCTINDHQGCGPDGVPSYLYFRDSETHADSKGRYVETGSEVKKVEKTKNCFADYEDNLSFLKGLGHYSKLTPLTE